MNGSCAGGTGAFIDQMATLLDTDAAGLNDMAKHYETLYPIASRCGVFAKTDLQPLINDGAAKPDLAASIFTAVATQTIAGLASGRPIQRHRHLPRRPVVLHVRAARGVPPRARRQSRRIHRADRRAPVARGVRLRAARSPANRTNSRKASISKHAPAPIF